MTEANNQKPEDKLLKDILNALDITFRDSKTKEKMRDIMQQGIGRLEQLKAETDWNIESFFLFHSFALLYSSL